MTRETSTSSSATSTSGLSTSSGSKPCSVETILNDMSRSFASCKTTGLFRFYQESTKKKGSCSINWTSNTIAPGAVAAAAAGSSGNCSDCSSWLSSGSFWSTSNNLASSGAGATTGTTTDTMDSYASAAHTTLNQLLSENRMVSSVTQQLEERFTNFMANNTMQITTTGVFLGALTGAAVATGVIVGMMAATGAIGAAASEHVPHFIQLLKSSRRRRIGKGDKPSIQPKDDGPGSREDEATNTSDSTKSTSVVSTNGPLVIVQGHPSSSLTAARDQCRSCLQNIETNLLEQPEDLQWNHIRRLTVYLVSGKCHASLFRQVLDEYNNNNNNNATSKTDMLVSILYVQQLEDEAALLQIEAMASRE